MPPCERQTIDLPTRAFGEAFRSRKPVYLGVFRTSTGWGVFDGPTRCGEFPSRIIALSRAERQAAVLARRGAQVRILAHDTRTSELHSWVANACKFADAELVAANAH